MSKKNGKTYRKINEGNYELIKTLAAHGVSKTDICKSLGICSATCYRVLTSKDLEEYHKFTNEQSKEAKARRRARIDADKYTAVELPKEEPKQKKAVVEFSEIEFKTHTGPQLNIIMDLLKQQLASNNAIIKSLEQLNSKLDILVDRKHNDNRRNKFWH